MYGDDEYGNTGNETYYRKIMFVSEKGSVPDKPEDRFIDIYYYHWNAPDGDYLNGEEIDTMNCWTRRIKCTVDPATGEWVQTVIKQEWEE